MSSSAELPPHLRGGRVKTAVIEGVRYRYLDAGSGEPILMLHGYPQSRRIWDRCVQELSATHRLVVPDLPGWGDSYGPLDASYRFPDECRRLERFIELVIDGDFNLFAHDYGALLSLGLSSAAWRSIRRLAILNSRCHRGFRTMSRWRFSMLAFAATLGPLFRLLPLRLLHARALRRELGPFVGDDVLRGYEEPFSRPDFIEWFRLFWAEGYGMPDRPELAARIRDFAGPAAVVWGVHDEHLSAGIAKELAAMLRSCELTLLDCGHFPLEQSFGGTFSALQRLLSRPAGAGGRAREAFP